MNYENSGGAAADNTSGRNAIECAGLRKVYRSFTLEGLDLTVPEGTICGLVGENGAGKTTTLRLLMGAARPDGGTARVLGADPHSTAFRAAKEDIGVVLDEAYFPEVLTAAQVGKVLRGTYRNWDEAAWDGWMKRFHLPEKTQFKDYSRGMRMKLSIAAALSHHPRLLVLDEPTSGLDPIVRDEVVETFRDFGRQDNHSIFISSHILSDLEKLCDSIAFLREGKLLFCEDKDALLEQYGLFSGTAEQLESIQPDAVVGREAGRYSGVRALLRRNLVPDVVAASLERPTVEDVVLFTVRGAKERDGAGGPNGTGGVWNGVGGTDGAGDGSRSGEEA